MEDGVNLAEQTRSLIDRLNVRQVMISNQLKTIATENPGILKKSKSVSFLDAQSQQLKVKKKIIDQEKTRFFFEILVVDRSISTTFDFKTTRQF